ncbi:MAG: MFS transporter [Anaerolineaceae bacterium]
MKKVNGWYLFVLNAYWIGLSFMWNSLHVTILPAVLLNYVPATQKNTWLGLLTFFGLILAMLIQPISGAISDRWNSRIGKRRPFVIFGTAGDLVFLSILGFVGGLPALFVGYIGLQITSNIAHGPLQGLMPDEVPPEKLGLASGIKTFTDMVGIILSSLLMGFLISSKNANPAKSVAAIIGLLVVMGLITILFSHEKTSPKVETPRIGFGPFLKSVFNFKMEGDKGYWTLILSRFLYLVGIYGFQSFAQYFIRDKFPAQEPVAFTQLVMGVFVVVLIVFSMLAGAISDRMGRKKVQILSSILGAFGAMLMIFAVTPFQLIAFSTFLGAGLGMFLSTNWALANEMAPAAEAGKYMGLTNLATAGSAALARLEGPMIDGFNNIAPGVWIGWTVLFAVSAALMIASAVVIRKVNEPKIHAKVQETAVTES